MEYYIVVVVVAISFRWSYSVSIYLPLSFKSITWCSLTFKSFYKQYEFLNCENENFWTAVRPLKRCGFCMNTFEVVQLDKQ